MKPYLRPHSQLPCIVVALLGTLLSIGRAWAVEQLTAPTKTDDGWETAAPEHAHLAAAPLSGLIARIKDSTYKNIHSVLVVKNDNLAVEEYFRWQDADGKTWDFQRDSLHAAYSVTKSVNSILIGIAVDQHLIEGVDQKLSTLLPAYADIFAGSEKDSICLKHLLTMTAGLAWDEWTNPYADSRNSHFAMDASPDPVRHVLEQPLVHKPGEKFTYSSGNAIVLGAVLEQATGSNADVFAERNLFGPLGITHKSWWSYPNGIVQTGSGLYMLPRDMAKLGCLFLNDGQWQGKQIVSREWVRESTIKRVDARQFPDWIKSDGYGYEWWQRSFQLGEKTIPSFHAAGRGGQFIFVVPELQLVAVFTGWNDNALGSQPFEMFERYILASALGTANR